MTRSRFEGLLSCVVLAVAIAAWSPTAHAQVTGRITANNGYAFGFGSATAVATSSSPWVWNLLACDISCCAGWETYSIPSSTLAANEYAYILAAGDGDGRTAVTATFLDSMGAVILNTNTTGGEWEACDMGAQSGTTEPSGGWMPFVNARIAACTWVGLTTGWDGGNSCAWTPAPQWVWGAGIPTAVRRVLFRTRTADITPQLCVDDSSGLDTGCTASAPHCIGTGAAAACVACTTDAHCTDRNACTIDTCTAENTCIYASVARGRPGDCAPGFVCSGGFRNSCVDCVDDSLDVTDSGCGRGLPHCRTLGTGAPECEVCVDTVAGSGTDLGCTGAAPSCVLGPVGAWLCVACTSATDCNDGNECTTDACSTGACLHTSVAAGAACSTGVCDGASPNPLCAPCIDDAADVGLDTGCESASPLCLTTEDSVSCQPCEDTATGMADLGCTTAAAPACVTVGADNVCLPCEDTAADLMIDDGCDADQPMCVAGADGAPVCVSCTADADCSGDTPFCDVATGSCGGCRTNADCPVTDPVCSGEPLACGPCTVDAQCTEWTTTPICDAASGDCVALPEVDGGVTEVDAGADGGSIDGGGELGAISGGACGCSVPTKHDARGAYLGLMALGLLWVLRRRRA